MRYLRYIFSSLLMAAVIALGAYGPATAAGGIAHQAHCLNAEAPAAPDAAAHHAAGHRADLSEPADPHSTPGHDHQICVAHSCPALPATAVMLHDSNHEVFTTLSWNEKPFRLLELADALKRPPRT